MIIPTNYHYFHYGNNDYNDDHDKEPKKHKLHWTSTLPFDYITIGQLLNSHYRNRRNILLLEYVILILIIGVYLHSNPIRYPLTSIIPNI